jgi:hypothetical protein
MRWTNWPEAGENGMETYRFRCRINLESIIKKFHDDLIEMARKALTKPELTGDEKFAICYANGVPYASSISGTQVTFKTRTKCSMVRIDGKWRVFVTDFA